MHYFFGYYDISGFSGDDRRHLCHRVPFMDRMPTASDMAQLGVIDIGSGTFTALAETRAWNFQQGAMLQWYPYGGVDTFLYNDYSAECSFHCVIQSIQTGERRFLSRPVANVSRDGRYGVSVNFTRIYDFRPGYGYCNQKDPGFDVAQPDDDGIFLVDMQTGQSTLLASYRVLGTVFSMEGETPPKIVVNHITFNATGDRILFLLRHFPQKGSGWKTALGTIDLQGNIYRLRDYTYASHYHWKDERRLLIHADAGEGAALYELTDLSQDYTVYPRDFFARDIHCSYSPDRRFIIGDLYPDRDGFREILLYHVPSKRGISLGKVYFWPVSYDDIRCDLHVLWNNKGDAVSFDGTFEGVRGLYMLQLSDILKQF